MQCSTERSFSFHNRIVQEKKFFCFPLYKTKKIWYSIKNAMKGTLRLSEATESRGLVRRGAEQDEISPWSSRLNNSFVK